MKKEVYTSDYGKIPLESSYCQGEVIAREGMLDGRYIEIRKDTDGNIFAVEVDL